MKRSASGGSTGFAQPSSPTRPRIDSHRGDLAATGAPSTSARRELKKLKRMTTAGLAAFAKRTEAKSRVYTYEQRNLTAIDDKAVEKKFKANKKAWNYFQSQAPYYRKLMIGWLNMAKAEETRLRRLDKLMAACESGRRMMP